MSSTYRAYAAESAGTNLQLREFEFLQDLGTEEVELQVESCGVCHSDLSMLHNEWGNSQFPFVGGHEVVGRVLACGSAVKRVKVGDRVGVGWTAASCGECDFCLRGDAVFCAVRVPTIVGRHGGFSERMRCHWLWAVKLPSALDPRVVGPLFCGGITVFNPFLEFGVLPTHRVAVLGIGGLGHLAIKFARAWGTEVTAITSNAAKTEELLAMGAHRVVHSRSDKALQPLRGAFDLIISTVNIPPDWSALLRTLAPRGKLVLVGVTVEPLEIQAMQLISGQKAIVGNATGSPLAIATMLDFCARHQIVPTVEHFPMAMINEALAHLEAGRARYRIVLEN